jgi:hypothetical protein
MNLFAPLYKLILILLVLITVPGCVSVQPYQMIYLNNSDMNLSGSNLDEFNTNFQSYREGAVGGNEGNRGNGCGCN